MSMFYWNIAGSVNIVPLEYCRLRQYRSTGILPAPSIPFHWNIAGSVNAVPLEYCRLSQCRSTGILPALSMPFHWNNAGSINIVLLEHFHWNFAGPVNTVPLEYCRSMNTVPLQVPSTLVHRNFAGPGNTVSLEFCRRVEWIHINLFIINPNEICCFCNLYIGPPQGYETIYFTRHQRNCIFIYFFKFLNTHAIFSVHRIPEISKKNIGEKCFGVSILSEPNLDNIQPMTTLLSTAGALIKVSN